MTSWLIPPFCQSKETARSKVVRDGALDEDDEDERMEVARLVAGVVETDAKEGADERARAVGDASSDAIESTDGLRGRLPLPLLVCGTTAWL
jgi:hypothetical protein